MENNLPKGWKECLLSDVVEYKKGKKPKRLEFKPFKDSVTYLDIKAIEKGADEIFADRESSNITNENELVIVWDGSRAGWVGLSRNGALGSTLMALRPKIDKNYLYRYLQTQFSLLQTNHRGTGIPHVDPDIFWNINIPIPPLPEQHRIIAKLDALFVKIESNNQRLEKIPQLLKRFRQSILASAVSGKLTEGWRVDNGIKEEWEEKTLKNFGEITGGITLNSKRQFLPKKMPYLRVGNVYSNQIILDEIKTIGVLDQEIEKTLLVKGDLLIVEGNGSSDQIGRVAQWQGEIDKCLHQNHLIKFRSDNYHTSRYILYYLLSLYGREQIEKASKSTSGLYTLNISKVSSLEILFPPNKKEQQEIVRRVEQLFAVADQIEARYAKVKTMLDKLPRAILAKAFRGELAPQDENDEPAGMLLERIKAEKKYFGKNKK